MIKALVGFILGICGTGLLFGFMRYVMNILMGQELLMGYVDGPTLSIILLAFSGMVVFSVVALGLRYSNVDLGGRL
jgi:hypothetical protein